MSKRRLSRTTLLLMGAAALSLLLTLPSSALALATKVESVRHHATHENTRIVFDLSGPLKREPVVFPLRNPDRLVLDLPAETVSRLLPSFSSPSVVTALRTGLHDDYLRIVLDLAEPVTFTSFTLAPGNEESHRLVFDLKPIAQETGQSIDSIIAAWESININDLDRPPVSAEPPAQGTPPAKPTPAREIVIAIDAGHGGKDPGAIGRGGTYEKKVVLAMAKRLKRMIDAEPGYRAMLTRTGDYYVGLRERVTKARDANADFFVSIHADAVDRPGPRGSSIYALSRRGATSTTARWLAQSENEAFLVNGEGHLSLAGADPATRNTLLDLSLTSSVNFSIALGSDMLAQLGQVNRLHKENIELANFAVLRSPDLPSVLVETGFISTPAEEKLLLDPQHQEKLMAAVFAGIQKHFSRDSS